MSRTILTVEKVAELKVGDSISDMHYALPKCEDGIEMMYYPMSVEAATVLLDQALLGGIYINKMLKVVSKVRGTILAAYTYDGRSAGLVTFDLEDAR
jgi:hypothetical protein